METGGDGMVVSHDGSEVPNAMWWWGLLRLLAYTLSKVHSIPRRDRAMHDMTQKTDSVSRDFHVLVLWSERMPKGMLVGVVGCSVHA